jgi:hypothetical protein
MKETNAEQEASGAHAGLAEAFRAGSGRRRIMLLGVGLGRKQHGIRTYAAAWRRKRQFQPIG